MAPYARKTFRALDASGNLIKDPTVRVRRVEAGMPLVPLYSDRAGLNQISNPVTFNDGKITFCLEGGLYEIRVTASRSASLHPADPVMKTSWPRCRCRLDWRIGFGCRS